MIKILTSIFVKDHAQKWSKICRLKPRLRELEFTT